MKHKNENFDENSYCMLLKKSKEKLLCDFCDETFNSRYSNIIHNAHHIVIPLLNQEVHQCKKCLFYFQSHDDLVSHLVIKHNGANKHITKVISNIQTTSTGQIESNHQPTTSEELKTYSNLKELKIVDITDDDDEQICSHGSNSNLSMKKLSNIQASDNREKFVSPNDIPNLIVKKRKCENLETNIEKKTLYNDQQNYSNVKHIKTKEDIVTSPWSVAIHKKMSAYENQCDSMLDIKSEEYILPDVYYDVKISPNLQVKHATMVPETNLQSNLNIKKTNIDQNENDDGILLDHDMHIDKIKPNHSKSIHYSELTVQSKLSCKYCQKVNIFPNRYTLILHETSHLSIMNHQPNICIICNLYFKQKDYERHMKYNHPNIIKKQNNLKTCLICGFKHYNYKKHLKQYHYNIFLWEDDIFLDQYKKREITYGNIIFKCVNPISNSNSDIARVCKCYMTNWRNSVKYKRIGTLTRKGSLLKCNECGKEVNKICFVEKYIDRFKFEGDFKKQKKYKSNEQRLRNIQSRLKMINKLSRFYMYFLLVS